MVGFGASLDAGEEKVFPLEETELRGFPALVAILKELSQLRKDGINRLIVHFFKSLGVWVYGTTRH